MRKDSDFRFVVSVVLLCMLWYAESSTSNVLNKILLSKFPYPMTIAMSSLIATGFLSIPVIKMWGIPYRRTPPGYLYKFLIPLSLGKIVAISSAFASIWKIPVSYAHTVKATMPLFAVLVARMILKESQTWLVYFSLLPIMVGVAIATVTELSFNLLGLLAALCSTLTYAFLNVFVKKTLQDTGIHHLRLLSMMAQVACVFLLPIWCLHDLVSIWRDWFSPERPAYFTGTTIAMIMFAGCLNFAQNLVTFTLIHKLTALSYAVANATKRIIIITSSIFMLRNPVTPWNVVGMCLSILGVFAYNRAKQYQKRKKGLRPTFTAASLSDATLFQHYSSGDLSQIPLRSIAEAEEGGLVMETEHHYDDDDQIQPWSSTSENGPAEHRIPIPLSQDVPPSNYMRRSNSIKYQSKVV